MKTNTKHAKDLLNDLFSISQYISDLSVVMRSKIELIIKESLPDSDLEALTSDYI